MICGVRRRPPGSISCYDACELEAPHPGELHRVTYANSVVQFSDLEAEISWHKPPRKSWLQRLVSDLVRS